MTFPFRLPIVGTITANAQTVFADIAGSPQCVLALTGTFSGHNVTFEVSYDSTNGTDGNWVQMAATRSNKSVSETTSGSSSTAPSYSWIVTTMGAQYVRVRATAHSSGTATWRIQPCAEQQNFNTEPTAGVPNGTAVVGGPMRIGLRGRSIAAVVSNDQVVDAIGTLNGALVTKPHAIPESCWQGTGVLTTTADLAIKAAAGASVRNFVSDFSYQNTSATATGIVIKDGSTVIAQFHAPANMVTPAVVSLQCPLRGTANTTINVAALVTAANILVNACGHTGT